MWVNLTQSIHPRDNMDDWGSDELNSDTDLGDISALPEVKVPEPPPQAHKPARPALAIPPVNAWTQRRESGDARVGRHPLSAPPRSSASTSTPPGVPRKDNHFAERDRSRKSPLPASRPNQRSNSHSQRGTTLYVTNLPLDTNEQQVAEFFKSCAVSNVRLTYYNDTGNIKAAFVTLQPEEDPQKALALNGQVLANRALHVKIDGSDRRGPRDRAYGSSGFGPAASPNSANAHSNAYAAPSYGGSFGSRERRAPTANATQGNTNTAASSVVSPPPGIPSPNTNESKGVERAERAAQPADPTIPTGPTPAGRKRLQLKPRTKPLPTLEIDHRAIGDTRSRTPNSAPPALRNGARTDMQPTSKSTAKQLSHGKQNGPRPDGMQQRRTPAREGHNAQGRAPSARSTSEKVDDTSKPTLHNAFAILGVDEEAAA